ncbi:MAG: alpha/beta hydrolase-fold protein [Candidatus Eremiobacteraeota bacterium]|nr:alpha/beta hydrolase-fold protein [Candidatus Eremiobacteraeota bacterium]
MIRVVGRMAAAALIAGCFFAPCASGAQGTAISTELLTTNRLFLDRFDDVARAGGRNLAADIASRMILDGAAVSGPVPANFSKADWEERLSNVVRLDSELVRALLGERQEPLQTLTGLHERLARVDSDGTLQPYSIYIPSSFRAAAKPSIVVLLHGQPQTETELLGASYFRRIAEAGGSIVVVPWGRGNYDYAPPADREVYTALDDVLKAFPVSPRHVYLAGYSMGGFSVFKVAPIHPDRWAAVLCISGALLPADAALVRFKMRDTPFYVVTGKLDTSVAAVYGELTVGFLQDANIPVSFYEDATAEHWLSTLVKPMSAAWSDMLSGISHTGGSRFEQAGRALLNVAPPSMTMKP